MVSITTSWHARHICIFVLRFFKSAKGTREKKEEGKKKQLVESKPKAGSNDNQVCGPMCIEAYFSTKKCQKHFLSRLRARLYKTMLLILLWDYVLCPILTL